MPKPETSSAFGDITYWAENGWDDEGDIKVSAAVAIKGRLIHGKREGQTGLTSEVATDATLTDLDQDLKVNSIIWEGHPDDYSTAENLFQVVEFRKVPDIKGRNYRRSAFLMRWKNELPSIP